MCLFNSNCINPCERRRYIVGPMGPMGPRGPIGPQGERGTSDAIYANSLAQTVATDAIIPITLNSATPNSTMSVTANQLNLPQGSYLITYSLNGSTASGTVALSLYQNGVPIPNETISATSGANDEVNLSKTILYNSNGINRLSLYNTSEDTASITNATITALKVV